MKFFTKSAFEAGKQGYFPTSLRSSVALASGRDQNCGGHVVFSAKLDPGGFRTCEHDSHEPAVQCSVVRSLPMFKSAEDGSANRLRIVEGFQSDRVLAASAHCQRRTCSAPVSEHEVVIRIACPGGANLLLVGIDLGDLLEESAHGSCLMKDPAEGGCDGGSRQGNSVDLIGQGLKERVVFRSSRMFSKRSAFASLRIEAKPPPTITTFYGGFIGRGRRAGGPQGRCPKGK